MQCVECSRKAETTCDSCKRRFCTEHVVVVPMRGEILCSRCRQERMTDTWQVNTCPSCGATDTQNVRRLETCLDCGGAGWYQSGSKKRQQCINCKGKGEARQLRKQCKKCEMIWVPES